MVMVPDDNNSLDILGLYNGIGSHAFDQLEPFSAFRSDKSVRVQVGKSQTAQDYQDIPLCVKVSDAVQTTSSFLWSCLKTLHPLTISRTQKCPGMLPR